MYSKEPTIKEKVIIEENPPTENKPTPKKITEPDISIIKYIYDEYKERAYSFITRTPIEELRKEKRKREKEKRNIETRRINEGLQKLETRELKADNQGNKWFKQGQILANEATRLKLHARKLKGRRKMRYENRAINLNKKAEGKFKLGEQFDKLSISYSESANEVRIKNIQRLRILGVKEVNSSMKSIKIEMPNISDYIDDAIEEKEDVEEISTALNDYEQEKRDFDINIETDENKHKSLLDDIDSELESNFSSEEDKSIEIEYPEIINEENEIINNKRKDKRHAEREIEW